MKQEYGVRANLKKEGGNVLDQSWSARDRTCMAKELDLSLIPVEDTTSYRQASDRFTREAQIIIPLRSDRDGKD